MQSASARILRCGRVYLTGTLLIGILLAAEEQLAKSEVLALGLSYDNRTGASDSVHPGVILILRGFAAWRADEGMALLLIRR